MNFDKKQLRNTLLLLLGALIWGTAFVAQSVGSGYVGPYTFLAARSWLACAFLIVLVLLRRGKARKADPGVPFWINGRMLLRGGARDSRPGGQKSRMQRRYDSLRCRSSMI